MHLHLKRPLAFFDLETTGVNIATDRIVELGLVIMNTDGSTTEKRYLVNPTIHIPVEASLVHGIYDKDVADAPTFEQLAQELFDLLNPCDLGGFNSNRFDVPLLIEEFLRLNLNFSLDSRNLIDVRNIYAIMEKRDLSSTYKYFCGKELVNAHSAVADVRATHEIFMAQLEKYDDLPKSIEEINLKTRNDLDQIDTANRLAKIDGKPCFNFGKYKGQTVEDVLKKDPGYYAWIQRSDFTLHTKQKLKEIKLSLQL